MHHPIIMTEGGVWRKDLMIGSSRRILRYKLLLLRGLTRLWTLYPSIHMCAGKEPRRRDGLHGCPPGAAGHAQCPGDVLLAGGARTPLLQDLVDPSRHVFCTVRARFDRALLRGPAAIINVPAYSGPPSSTRTAASSQSPTTPAPAIPRDRSALIRHSVVHPWGALTRFWRPLAWRAPKRRTAQ